MFSGSSHGSEKGFLLKAASMWWTAHEFVFLIQEKSEIFASLRRMWATAKFFINFSAYNLDTDYEHNLDRVHNVYRESLDSRTLELLNLRSRNSFIQDQAVLFDALNLEDGSVARRCALCSKRVGRSGSMRQQQQRERDAVDGRGNPVKQVSLPFFNNQKCYTFFK